MKIIFTDCAYTDACQLANMPCLVDRREQLSRRFFSRICDANNCLNYLLPEQRDSRITNSHRTAKKYPVPFAKTTHFKKLVYSLCFSKLSMTLVI